MMQRWLNLQGRLWESIDMQDIKDTTITDEARQKLTELLQCGNERVELAAAKELVSIFAKDDEGGDNEINLEVTITIKE